MVSLEQVKLLESKVIKALEYIDQVTGENTLLREKLEIYQKRIDGLEVVVQRFKEDQTRIEEGIVSALNRLNRFEADIEKSLALEEFQEDSASGKAARTEAADTPHSQEGEEDQSLSSDSSPKAAEEKTGGESIPEPGAEGTSDETLSPGELDIF